MQNHIIYIKKGFSGFRLHQLWACVQTIKTLKSDSVMFFGTHSWDIFKNKAKQKKDPTHLFTQDIQ